MINTRIIKPNKMFPVNPLFRKPRSDIFSKNFTSKNMSQTWFVSICHPYYKPELAWTASTTIDELSADTLASIGGNKVKIEKIEARNQSEAIANYKAMHPEFKKYFAQLDSQDVDLSL